ncbi:hypothetical protein FRACYDRAFT_240539 [Fragilariopsis cylindrus CCMP1102]|uniref:Uncharacterized protein n=1 Tax=Fragilariopsis cylindrus CCMP1102 TaxID=635003 RepID=A0A1E7FDF2_9STRA|nr:hypothetical protein FRACYDRAFT_240539 [Fragilariopsis cylindrus CCMP1102]|eukprot:OEU15843.1 hypothetical protein FRACYDRAFT_240539 [Fragilariopsis cylindrus CCMP1102]
MPISKQQDDHHEHHDQHRNNHSNHNNVEYRYSLEKNRNCTTNMNTTTDNRLESMFHQKKMIQSNGSSSSSSRSLRPQFEIPKTLMRNDSISIDNNDINDSEKSMKFLRGLYSTLPGIREKQQRRNTKRDDDEEEEEITTEPIQYDNYVNKRQIISKNKTSIAGKRRNELLLDDASEIYDAIQAMKSEFEGLSSGDNPKHD